MHYYATYALARAAGIKSNEAKTIATSAQFVDDNTAQNHIDFKNGARIDREATAHHPKQISNLDGHDQRRVWVPFHFIPGNIGDSYTERLKCRKDSSIVHELCDHHLNYADRNFALHLLGITAHVYADTFSHYGFSGVSSRGNKVNNSSFRYHEEVEGLEAEIEELSSDMRDYVINEKKKFFKKFGAFGGLRANINGFLAEMASGALGHGAVATLPDRPYLVWSFEYEREDAIDGNLSIRNNPVTFLEGCRALHKMFKQFASQRPDLLDSSVSRDFNEIESEIRKILLVQADKSGRINAWRKAANSGTIFGTGNEKIPEYEGLSWNEQWEQLDKAENYDKIEKLPVWQFYRAAALHRTYVLRDLLPKYNIIVN